MSDHGPREWSPDSPGRDPAPSTVPSLPGAIPLVRDGESLAEHYARVTARHRARLEALADEVRILGPAFREDGGRLLGYHLSQTFAVLASSIVPVLQRGDVVQAGDAVAAWLNDAAIALDALPAAALAEPEAERATTPAVRPPVPLERARPPYAAAVELPAEDRPTTLLVSGQPARPVNTRAEMARAFAEGVGDVMRDRGVMPAEAEYVELADGTKVLRFPLAPAELWAHARHRRLDRFDLPLGAVVCTAIVKASCPVVDLATGAGDPEDCGQVIRWSDGTGPRLEHRDRHEVSVPAVDITDQLPYGNYAPGRFAWELTGVRWAVVCPGNGIAPCHTGRTGFSVPVLNCHRCGGYGDLPFPIAAKGRQGWWTWTP